MELSQPTFQVSVCVGPCCSCAWLRDVLAQVRARAPHSVRVGVERRGSQVCIVRGVGCVHVAWVCSYARTCTCMHTHACTTQATAELDATKQARQAAQAELDAVAAQTEVGGWEA